MIFWVSQAVRPVKITTPSTLTTKLMAGDCEEEVGDGMAQQDADQAHEQEVAHAGQVALVV